MKKQFAVTQIDEERIKGALRNSGALDLKAQPILRARDGALVNSILASIVDAVWMFNMDYDPKKEGYKTKEPVKVADDLEDLFLEIVSAIGAKAEFVGEHY